MTRDRRFLFVFLQSRLTLTMKCYHKQRPSNRSRQLQHNFNQSNLDTTSTHPTQLQSNINQHNCNTTLTHPTQMSPSHGGPAPKYDTSLSIEELSKLTNLRGNSKGDNYSQLGKLLQNLRTPGSSRPLTNSQNMSLTSKPSLLTSPPSIPSPSTSSPAVFAQPSSFSYSASLYSRKPDETQTEWSTRLSMNARGYNETYGQWLARLNMKDEILDRVKLWLGKQSMEEKDILREYLIKEVNKLRTSPRRSDETAATESPHD